MNDFLNDIKEMVLIALALIFMIPMELASRIRL
jgi:hypothetical protein